MKVVYTKHAAEEKFQELEKHGWKITRTKIESIIKNPQCRGVSKQDQETAMGLIDEKHILRIILRRENDIINVITFHMARRGKYETTL